MFSNRLLRLASTSQPGVFGATATLFLLIAFLWISGCNKTPPPVIDLAKAPWLDPQAQIKGLKDSNFRIRGLSANNLGNMGPKAADALPELQRVAHDDPNESVRKDAQEAIAKIRPASK